MFKTLGLKSRWHRHALNNRKLAALTVVTALLTSLFSLTAQAAADRQALLAVEGYMAALIVGDTQTMGARMGEKMQAERGKILANPSYSKTLQRAYAGAQYEVVSSNQLDSGRAEVTVRIRLASDDNVHVRFELAGAPDYYIVSES